MTEEDSKISYKDYYAMMMEINGRLASIETSINAFPEQIKKLEQKEEQFSEIAVEAKRSADEANERLDKLEEEKKHSMDNHTQWWIAAISMIITTAVSIWSAIK